MQKTGKKSGWGHYPTKPKKAPTPDHFHVPTLLAKYNSELDQDGSPDDKDDHEEDEMKVE